MEVGEGEGVHEEGGVGVVSSLRDATGEGVRDSREAITSSTDAIFRVSDLKMES